MMSQWVGFLSSVKRPAGVIATLIVTCLGSLSAVISLEWTEALLIAVAVTCTVLLIRFGLRQRHERVLSEFVRDEIDRSLAVRTSLQDQRLLKERLNRVIRLLYAPRAAGGRGAHALTDLPWYLVIGPSGAGKTSLLAHSGLALDVIGPPSEEAQAQRPSCDWYFSPEAVFIDTAGKYLDDRSSAQSFCTFLRVLKRKRATHAINGMLLTIGLDELIVATPVERQALASRLSRQLNDYAHALGARVPVYLVLTKADRIPGFLSLFGAMDDESRQQPWGMTWRDGAEEGSKHCDETFATFLNDLHRYLDDEAVCSDRPLDAQGLQFAHYVAALSEVLKDFLTAFESGGPAVQLRSVHLTSARQDSVSLPPVFMERIMEMYTLEAPEDVPEPVVSQPEPQKRFFIADVFRQIILPDPQAVSLQPIKNNRLSARVTGATLMFVAAICLLAFKAYDVHADRQWLQALAGVLASASTEPNVDAFDWREFEALGEQLSSTREALWDVPESIRARIGMSGLEEVHRALRAVYAQQLQRVLATPLEAYLQGKLQTLERQSRAPGEGPRGDEPVMPQAQAPAGDDPFLASHLRSSFGEATRASITDTYNALKLYLMLTDPAAHSEPAFVDATLPLVWRKALTETGMEVDSSTLAASAAQVLQRLDAEPAPMFARDEWLVARLRERLASFMAVNTLADREYLRLQLEHSQHAAALTLTDLVPGAGRRQLYSTAAIPGFFTLQGWAFLQHELMRLLATDLKPERDWVLHGEAADEGQVQNARFVRDVVARYKTDYARAWLAFLNETGVRKVEGLSAVAQQLSQVSDAQDSPLKTLMTAVDRQTRWDLPRRSERSKDDATTGLPETLPVSLSLSVDVEDGSLARHFEPVSRLFVVDPTEGQDSTLMARYLSAVRRLKVRVNTLQRSQDVGKGSKRLISETLDGQTLNGQISELSGAYHYLENRIDTSESGLAVVLQRLFSTPLQNTWVALREPSRVQISDVWLQQIVRPWQATVADRYPISAAASNEVSVKDVLRFIRPDDGLLSTFAREQLGNLAMEKGEGGVAEGDTPLVALVSPHVLSSIARADAIGRLIESLGDPDNGFEVAPTPSAAFTDIIFTLDGQTLHYRNGKVRWQRLVWPAPSETPGARLDVVTLEGQRVTVFDHPGRWGLLRMIEGASVTQVDDVRQRLSWHTDVGKATLIVRNHGVDRLTELARIKSLRFEASARNTR